MDVELESDDPLFNPSTPVLKKKKKKKVPKPGRRASSAKQVTVVPQVQQQPSLPVPAAVPAAAAHQKATVSK